MYGVNKDLREPLAYLVVPLACVMEIKAVRGMHDLWGEPLARWKAVEARIHAVFSGFGYEEIRTPVLEHRDVFCQAVGTDTDIVEKQMYQVQAGDEPLVLRPEATASVVRAVLEHQLHRQALPQRYYYYMPMFRHERPQKGRLRQFHQFGAELMGDSSPEADAEVIVLLDAIFRAVGLSDYRVRVNSVGSEACRPQYRAQLKKWLEPHLAELCDLCRKRFDRAPMRILDCKNPKCAERVVGAPRMIEFLDPLSRDHYGRVKECLRLADVEFEEDTGIVRGLDYYSRTAFEFTSDQLGAQSALGGGGRYDELSTRFGAEAFACVGWALGMERLMLALGDTALVRPQQGLVYLAPLGSRALQTLYPLSLRLKRAGVRAELPYESEKKLKVHLKHASRLGAEWAVMLGDDELTNGQAIIKDMKAGEQTLVPLSALEAELKGRIRV